jgi:hypothetical protein
MKRAYRWRCFACDDANAASATSCASCGFPAVASGAEIARAQAARRMGAAPPLPSAERAPSATLAQALADWKGWRLGFGIAGAVLLAIGAYAAKDILSWRSLGVSMFALMFGLILLLVAWAARSPTART